MPRPPNPHRDAILDLWKGGMSRAAIARHLGLTDCQVHKQITGARAHGDPRAVNRRAPWQAVADKVRPLLRQGLTCGQVVVRTGCSLKAAEQIRAEMLAGGEVLPRMKVGPGRVVVTVLRPAHKSINLTAATPRRIVEAAPRTPPAPRFAAPYVPLDQRIADPAALARAEARTRGTGRLFDGAPL